MFHKRFDTRKRWHDIGQFEGFYSYQRTTFGAGPFPTEGGLECMPAKKLDEIIQRK